MKLWSLYNSGHNFNPQPIKTYKESVGVIFEFLALIISVNALCSDGNRNGYRCYWTSHELARTWRTTRFRGGGVEVLKFDFGRDVLLEIWKLTFTFTKFPRNSDPFIYQSTQFWTKFDQNYLIFPKFLKFEPILAQIWEIFERMTHS